MLQSQKSSSFPTNLQNYQKHKLTQIPNTTFLKQTCPFCKQTIRFRIEKKMIAQVDHFPFTHIVIHGEPLHALILYIDHDMKIRGVESGCSVEFERNSQTFHHILQKWSNPF